MLKLILMRIGEDRGSAEGPPAGLARGLLGEEPTGTAVIAQIPPSINKVNYTPKDTSSYLPPNPSTCVKQEAWATPKEMSSVAYMQLKTCQGFSLAIHRSRRLGQKEKKSF